MPPVEETDSFQASVAYKQAQSDKSGEDEDSNDGDEASEGSGESKADTRVVGEKATSKASGEDLTEEERQQVEKLKDRDAEVRSHEAAHMAAGGSHVRGGASFSYQQGPDGKQYAIGGEVGIDVSAVAGNPQATMQKMQQVRAAALAPASPSGPDRSVAAKASQAEMKARQQLAEQAAQRYGANGSSRQPGAAEAAGADKEPTKAEMAETDTPAGHAPQRLEVFA